MPITSEPRVAPVPPGTAVDCGGGAGEPATGGVELGTAAQVVVGSAPAGAATVSAPRANPRATMVTMPLSVADPVQLTATRTSLPVPTDSTRHVRLVTSPGTSVALGPPPASLVAFAGAVKVADAQGWAAEFCGHLSREGEGHTDEGRGCSRSASTGGGLTVDRRRSISDDALVEWAERA